MLKMLLKNRRQPANVFIMLVAIVIFGFLMGLSYSIGQLKMINLEQSSAQTIKTKLRLINNSGLNEVIATQLFPTSNRYSWQFDSVADISTADPVTKPKPFLTDSSYVYETGAGVVGRYQYIVLGVNPYFDYDTVTGAYTPSEDKMKSGEHLYNIDNPIYVAVRSFACFDTATSAIAYDAVKPHTVPPYAKCGSGQTLEERTTLTELDVSNIVVPIEDLNTKIEIVSSQTIEADTTLTLPSKILNRNNSSTNQFNFEDWWTNRSGGIHYSVRGNAEPVGILYTKMVGADPTKFYLPFTGNPFTLPSDAIVPSLEILFRSAIDERSLYVVDHATLGNKYVPVSTVFMGVDSPTFPGYVQEAFSGTILSKDGAFGAGSFSQTIGFPSLSLLKISGSVPCESTNRIIFNNKQQLRDADGFRNTMRYTFKYTAPTC
ncbi:MAG: hypothetical protein ACK551_06605 [Vampirovibrionales bacterium]